MPVTTMFHSDSTDKVRRYAPWPHEPPEGWPYVYVAAVDFDALQARYDALEKSRGEFIKRSADYAAEIAALRKSVQLVIEYGDPPRDEHAFTRFAYHELKRAATGKGQL